ncbi:MAG: DASS family sodium-coupled anion symporter [Pseudomonadota bacterium]
MSTQNTDSSDAPSPRPGYVGKIGMALGPLLFVSTYLIGPPDGLSPVGWSIAGLAAWMATWWITEAVPLPATSLLPIVIIPLAGAGTVSEATEPFANRIVFLFLGGFLIAIAIERWELHRRLALTILTRLPGRPDLLVGGFMAVSAFLSMWMSNVAAALMMLPIGLSVIRLMDDGEVSAGRDFAIALMLGLAYAASIGGVGTLIGSVPNAFAAGMMDEVYGIQVGFGAWMVAALPLSLTLLVITWFLLCRVICRLPRGELAGARAMIAERHAELGAMTTAERRVALIAGLTAFLWVFRPLIADLLGTSALTDTGIAIGAAVLLFATRAGTGNKDRLLDWPTAKRVPWDILILFGGGLSLATAVQETGLAGWIGASLEGLADWPMILVVGIIVATVIFMTEIASNTATSATFIPIAAALALVFAVSPFDLAAPVAIAASCAFMLPVATPPNAIVYSSGAISIMQMVRAGILLNILAVILISIYIPWAIALVFD